MTIVLDTCALLAHHQEEPGGEQALLAIESGQAVIHAVNLGEVVYQLLKLPGVTMPQVDDLIRSYQASGLRISEDLSPTIWRGAATFRASVRRIAFADCFAVALAQSLNCPVLTSDRHEFDRPEVLTRCQVMFIR